MEDFKPKPFMQRPEGKTGMLFGAVIIGGLAYAGYLFLPFIIGLLQNTITAVLLFAVLAAVVYVLIDPRFRNLMWYAYKSVMRTITGLFVQIDPIGIIESYVDDLRNNLNKMGKQIASLRGQMQKLKTDIDNNEKMMQQNMMLAGKAKEKGAESIMVLKARKAGRLQDSNVKLQDLYKKMEVMYKVLCKMYENSGVLLEDIQDEVAVRKREREAIRASHSAMQSAMTIISGDKDRRQMFDQAMEAIADDIGKKVGEMERFMEISDSFMQGIDLQNGVFEEQGLEMLNKWEKEGPSFLLGKEKESIISGVEKSTVSIDLDAPIPTSTKQERGGKTQYTDMFDF
jgi:phage shock protein A